MALTRLDKTGDGVTTVVDVTFSLGYLREEYVYVYLDSDDYTTQLSYSWINATQIQLTTPVGVGVVYHVRRVIPRDNPVNDYQSGAILREQNLDDSFVQSLMVLEEIEDGYIVTSGDFILNSNIDMNGNRVTDMGAAIDPNDAVTKQVVDTLDSRVLAVESSVSTGSRWINWLYSNGSAIGGELEIDVPYNFTEIATLHINGVRQTYGIAYDYNATAKTVEFAEALDEGDELVISLGTEPRSEVNESIERASSVLQFDQVITESMTIASGSNALSVSPTLPIGVVVTVPVDSVYVIL